MDPKKWRLRNTGIFTPTLQKQGRILSGSYFSFLFWSVTVPQSQNKIKCHALIDGQMQE